MRAGGRRLSGGRERRRGRQHRCHAPQRTWAASADMLRTTRRPLARRWPAAALWECRPQVQAADMRCLQAGQYAAVILGNCGSQLVQSRPKATPLSSCAGVKRPRDALRPVPFQPEHRYSPLDTNSMHKAS